MLLCDRLYSFCPGCMFVPCSSCVASDARLVTLQRKGAGECWVVVFASCHKGFVGGIWASKIPCEWLTFA